MSTARTARRRKERHEELTMTKHGDVIQLAMGGEVGRALGKHLKDGYDILVGMPGPVRVSANRLELKFNHPEKEAIRYTFLYIADVFGRNVRLNTLDEERSDIS